jgi:hypothetical protein
MKLFRVINGYAQLPAGTRVGLTEAQAAARRAFTEALPEVEAPDGRTAFALTANNGFKAGEIVALDPGQLHKAWPAHFDPLDLTTDEPPPPPHPDDHAMAEDLAAAVEPPPSPEDDRPAFLLAIRAAAKVLDRNDFTAGGLPRLGALEQRLGRVVTAADRAEALADQAPGAAATLGHHGDMGA